MRLAVADHPSHGSDGDRGTGTGARRLRPSPGAEILAERVVTEVNRSRRTGGRQSKLAHTRVASSNFSNSHDSCHAHPPSGSLWPCATHPEQPRRPHHSRQASGLLASERSTRPSSSPGCWRWAHSCSSASSVRMASPASTTADRPGTVQRCVACHESRELYSRWRASARGRLVAACGFLARPCSDRRSRRSAGRALVRAATRGSSPLG
jgi:hypothetical protein